MNIESRIKNIGIASFIVSFLLYSLFVIQNSALAQTATPKPSASPTSKATATPSATPTSSPSESSSSAGVRDKVRQAIENLSHKPKAVIGVLDQVSDTTLQIKDVFGKPIQVATTGDTSYSKITKGKKTDIKFNDLAIGDFTVALGYKNGNDILEAKRVISYDQQPSNENKIFFATVTDLGKGSFTVNTKSGETWTIETKSATTLGKVTATKDLNTGDQVVVAGVPNDKKDKDLFADKIYVIGLATAPATASPSPTASPKASSTPKATPTPTP